MKDLMLCLGSALCLLVEVSFLERASAATYSDNRVAIDADGNYNDPDDWGATPMGLALLAKLGLQARLVHYSWANIIGPNDPSFYEEMKKSTLGAAERFGFNRAKFFDCRRNLAAALSNLRNQINLSSASNPLLVIAVGPMEVLWRAVNVSEPAKRQYVTVISHTQWNATKTYPPTMRHTRADVEALGVNWIQIKNQNDRLWTRNADGSPDWSPWFWLRDAARARMRWIYQRMRISAAARDGSGRTGKADVSDAGVVYYLLTNDQNATPSKLRTFFGNWAE
jgi:hypothetical protein